MRILMCLCVGTAGLRSAHDLPQSRHSLAEASVSALVLVLCSLLSSDCSVSWVGCLIHILIIPRLSLVIVGMVRFARTLTTHNRVRRQIQQWSSSG